LTPIKTEGWRNVKKKVEGNCKKCLDKWEWIWFYYGEVKILSIQTSIHPKKNEPCLAVFYLAFGKEKVMHVENMAEFIQKMAGQFYPLIEDEDILLDISLNFPQYLPQ
jgi:hypothetical protein